MGRSFTRIALHTRHGYVSDVELDDDEVGVVFVSRVTYVDRFVEAKLFDTNTWLMMESGLDEYIRDHEESWLTYMFVKNGEVVDQVKIFD